LYQEDQLDEEGAIHFSRRANNIDDNEASMMLNHAMASYELVLIRFFCTEQTFLRFRRNYRDWGTIVTNSMSLHKDIICFIVGVAVTVVVNVLEEKQYYALEFLKVNDCNEAGDCIDDTLTLDRCWCAVNLMWNIPSLILMIGGTVIGVVATMRTVMVVIYGVWLQQKLSLATWWVTTTGESTIYASGCNYELVLPESACITKAFFGYPKHG